jgi:hypothetical protein
MQAGLVVNRDHSMGKTQLAGHDGESRPVPAQQERVVTELDRTSRRQLAAIPICSVNGPVADERNLRRPPAPRTSGTYARPTYSARC